MYPNWYNSFSLVTTKVVKDEDVKKMSMANV